MKTKNKETSIYNFSSVVLEAVSSFSFKNSYYAIYSDHSGVSISIKANSKTNIESLKNMLKEYKFKDCSCVRYWFMSHKMYKIALAGIN